MQALELVCMPRIHKVEMSLTAATLQNLTANKKVAESEMNDNVSTRSKVLGLQNHTMASRGCF